MSKERSPEWLVNELFNLLFWSGYFESRNWQRSFLSCSELFVIPPHFLLFSSFWLVVFGSPFFYLLFQVSYCRLCSFGIFCVSRQFCCFFLIGCLICQLARLWQLALIGCFARLCCLAFVFWYLSSSIGTARLFTMSDVSFGENCFRRFSCKQESNRMVALL